MKARRFVRVIAAVLVAIMALSLVPAVSAEGQTVTVASVTEENGVVTVQGEAAELGQRKVEIIVRLTWENAQNYQAKQDFIYLDERVARVIDSYDASKANYGLAFAATFDGGETGAETNVTVTAVVISDTGVEIAGAPTTFTEV